MVAIPPTVSGSNGFDGCLKPDVLRRIRVRSRCLVRRLGCPHLSREDVEQEILIDLWRRWTRFDSARAQEQTFVERVVRNKVVELVRYHNRKKRGRDVHIFSLDQFVECRRGNATVLDERTIDPSLVHFPVDDRTELVADVAASVSSTAIALALIARTVIDVCANAVKTITGSERWRWANCS